MSEKIRVLAADDDEAIRVLLGDELVRRGYQVTTVANGREVLRVLETEEADVIVLDLQMPPLDGLETLRRLKAQGIEAEVVILTGHADLDSAIEAMKLGAFDYLTKPFKLAEVDLVLQKAHVQRQLRRENRALRQMVRQREPTPALIGRSPAMQALMASLAKIGSAESHVLIQGESGTGKELVARAIHQQSQRAASAFLVVNCGAFQDELLGSELFGHEKGSFTGAVSQKHGLFEVADGGTLFLDEVGEMSPAMQVKLLRALDSGEVRRVGSNRVIKTDVRIVAATNRDLAQEVAAKHFREDLFYRLNVLNINLPPLRQRKEDIPLLVDHFLGQVGLTTGRRKAMAPEALAVLTQYAWPGNIRELQNTVERLVILSDGDVILPQDLPPNLFGPARATNEEELASLSLKEAERLHIARVLSHHRESKAQVARILGIDVKTLNAKIRAYGLEAEPR